jgi:hypothetical protein
MNNNQLDLEAIQSSLDELLSYLNHPEMTLNDYQIIFNGLTEVLGVLLGYMEANYSMGELKNHNRMYWWTYMGELSRTCYGMAVCAYSMGNYDDVIDWASFAATANGDERFLQQCDQLCREAVGRQGKLLTRTLVEFHRLNPMDMNERAGELIGMIQQGNR